MRATTFRHALHSKVTISFIGNCLLIHVTSSRQQMMWNLCVVKLSAGTKWNLCSLMSGAINYSLANLGNQCLDVGWWRLYRWKLGSTWRAAENIVHAVIQYKNNVQSSSCSTIYCMLSCKLEHFEQRLVLLRTHGKNENIFVRRPQVTTYN